MLPVRLDPLTLTVCAAEGVPAVVLKALKGDPVTLTVGVAIEPVLMTKSAKPMRRELPVPVPRSQDQTIEKPSPGGTFNPVIVAALVSSTPALVL